jgi:transcriptional regulator with XRE-family HTH domain
MPKSVFTAEYAALLATLVSARKAAGLTQVELSAKLGRPQPFVSYAERGERRIDVVEFYAIALALGRDPVELFTEAVSQFTNAKPPQV